MIALDSVQWVCGNSDPAIALIYPFLISTMQRFQVDTPLREAMFIAQTAHESMRYTHLEEIASGQAYENRADLGNVQPGDGVKYKGRGAIQTTGRGNYGRMSQAIFQNSLLLEKPEMLCEPEYAALSAGFFWNWKVLNRPSDLGDVVAVTRKIQGGTGGLAERLALYKRACQVQGVQ